MKALVTAPYLARDFDAFRPLLEARGVDPVVVEVRQALSEDELLPLLEGVSGIVCGDDAVTARVLESSELRIVSKWGIGTDAIDKVAAARLGVQVTNTAGALDDPVADTVLGYVLVFARRLLELDRSVRGGGWEKPVAVSLSESTVGVVGAGSIGRAVVRRALAFGARVLVADPLGLPAELSGVAGVELAELDALLREADFVSLNADLNASSRHLVDARALALMKPTAVLVNTARGGLVDEAALADALERGVLAGAALDVFEVEPLPAGSPLRRLETCLLGTHNANSSPAAARRVSELAVRNLLHGLGLDDGS